MRLPSDFTKRMEAELGPEFPAFLACFEHESHHGLRVNELKIAKEDFLKLPAAQEFMLKPVPWCRTGFYYGVTETKEDTENQAQITEEIRPGRHVLHEAGAYYIQEPSAMSAVSMLDPKPGERILDLCAAPGGKSSQIASAMQGEGILIVNEIHPQRAKILSQNMERMGVSNALVVNESPDNLAEHFTEYFDKIVCDAPCSGEGMFRKDETAIQEWSPAHVEMCARRQQDILHAVYRMLKPGGRLVYSTCTFADEENEDNMAWFMETYPDMAADPAAKAPWFSAGKREGCFRLWPHKLDGEGHGVAVLRKLLPGDQAEKAAAYEELCDCGRMQGADAKGKPLKTIPHKDAKKLSALYAFEKEALKADLGGEYIYYGEQLYRVPCDCPPLDGLKCLRPGLKIGEMKGKVFKPDHALAMALRPDQVKNVLNLDHDEALKYLHGETVDCGNQKGWSLVCTDGVSLGWGKASGGVMKNHYPKGLRIQF